MTTSTPRPPAITTAFNLPQGGALTSYKKNRAAFGDITNRDSNSSAAPRVCGVAIDVGLPVRIHSVTRSPFNHPTGGICRWCRHSTSCMQLPGIAGYVAKHLHIKHLILHTGGHRTPYPPNTIIPHP